MTLWSLSKQNYPMWCLLDSGKGGIERSVNDNCRLYCCLLKISFGEFKHSHAKSFSRPLRRIKDFRNRKLVQKQKDQTHHLIVCAMYAQVLKQDFIISSPRACRKRIKRSTFLMIQADANGLLPTTVSSPDQSPQKKKKRTKNVRLQFHCCEVQQ